MKIVSASLLFLVGSTAAFTPAPRPQSSFVVKAMALDSDIPFYIDVAEEPKPKTKAPLKKSLPVKKNPAHKEGVFSPVVYWAKNLLGDEKLNSFRAKAISLHSDVIKGFVATADSAFGNQVLQFLYTVADKNGNGQIEEEELELALKTLGFKWLQRKQIQGIFARAGGKEKGYITMEEWMSEAPKTLKTNLVKLAKTNGGDLGFLV
eukprot:CAMPEP_0172468450 /NCGR_PEP_ID=MMETSP1065-20121228/61281_1 /TAXON_ID=265537 /ORGANISM="Amphiprora paludosa, Strain CCMP125" /LENGTH=205 /DNA_ID=CAMNT_0013225841 /DNA_START=12 /DNA_END=629 /DNA_ORIENTATION=+